MNGVKVTKTVVGAIQVGQNPRHVCLTEGVCLVARDSTASAQCSSSAAVQQMRVGALSPMPSCLGIGGHPNRSLQGHPRHTGARTAGRPWVARQDQTADTRQTVFHHFLLFFPLPLFFFVFVFVFFFHFFFFFAPVLKICFFLSSFTSR